MQIFIRTTTRVPTTRPLQSTTTMATTTTTSSKANNQSTLSQQQQSSLEHVAKASSREAKAKL